MAPNDKTKLMESSAVKSVLEWAMKNGGDFADLYVERRDTTHVSLEDGKIESFTTGRIAGAGLRIIDRDTSFYTYADSLDVGVLKKVADLLAEAVKAKDPSKLTSVVNDLEPVQSASQLQVKISPYEVERKNKADILLRADESARLLGPEIRQVSVHLVDSVQDVLIANSEGLLAEDRRTLTRFIVHVVAASMDTIQTGYEAPGITGGYELFEIEGPEKVAKDAAGRAVTMLRAKDAPTGEMPVILASGTSGVLFHEACGHGLEADAVRKGASVYTGKMDEQIASPVVSAADDPTIVNGWGSFAFDDEGTAAQKTLLIENGYLRSFMYDRLTATQFEVDLTSNGRRQSFRHVPQTRMTNTFIMAGESTVDDMLDGVERGLYAKSLGGGEVNPATGDFVFGVTEGYLVENGKITHPVKGAILIGNGPRVLKDIDMVSNDLAFDTGMCGKSGQSVPAGTGQPTLRVSRLTVGGTGHE